MKHSSESLEIKEEKIITSLPYPTGWFALGESSELGHGKVLPKKIMGKDLVIFRTHSGIVSALDAYCPHLGAHLGHGGQVKGELLQCPFHHLCFDAQGICSQPNLPKAKSWHVREINGMILVYYSGPNKINPVWEVPNLSSEGWTKPIVHNFHLLTHPQEVVENSVDVSHAAALHGFKSMNLIDKIKTEDHKLNMKYKFRETLDFAGFRQNAPFSEFNITSWGLGYLLIEVSIPVYGLHSRFSLFTSPTEKGYSDLRLVFSACEHFDRKKMHSFLGIFPHSFVSKLIFRVMVKKFITTLKEDFVIWENKQYVSQIFSDGPLLEYRKWAQQFYNY